MGDEKRFEQTGSGRWIQWSTGWTYADMLSTEEYVRHVDNVDVQTVFELFLELFVFVQVALFVPNAMVLQNLFDPLALVKR